MGLLGRPLLVLLAALVLTNVVTGWLAHHAIRERARVEAEAAAEIARTRDEAVAARRRAEQYRAAAEAAERAAMVAQQAARQAEAARSAAHRRLAELERANPDVRAWADTPIPGAVLECLRGDACH